MNGRCLIGRLRPLRSVRNPSRLRRGACSHLVLSAPWTLMIQMMNPMIGISVQNPVTPLTGLGWPDFEKMFPTSYGMRNTVHEAHEDPDDRPIGPPIPSWLWSFISWNVTYVQYRK